MSSGRKGILLPKLQFGSCKSRLRKCLTRRACLVVISSLAIAPTCGVWDALAQVPGAPYQMNQGTTYQGAAYQGQPSQGPMTRTSMVRGPITQGPMTQGPMTQGPMTQGPMAQGPIVQASTGPYIPAAESLQGSSWVTVGQLPSSGPQYGADERSGCVPCGLNSGFQMPHYVVPGPQPVGLTAGNCQPCITGIDCADSCGREQRWKDARSLNFQPLQHGEFVGPTRIPAVDRYRVRVGDEITFVYYTARQVEGQDYKLQVGDELIIASITDPTIKMGDNVKGVAIQPDGKIQALMIGPVRAVGLTIPQLRAELEKAYTKFLKSPAIDVQPFRTNTRLLDLKETVDSRFSGGGLGQLTQVNQDGRVSLPSIGPFYIYGMTLDEIRREVNLRYAERLPGLEVEPRIIRTAPHFVFVYGEVGKPGKYEMTSPTTVSQILAMAENVKNGGNQREIVIFRRAEDWRLIATKLDLRGAHLGRRPNPTDEIWLRDDDTIIVPPTPIAVFDKFVEQVLTNGVYRVVPFGGISIQKASN